ncbi:p21-activated protein kinase-interacting protein 1-like [Acipenser oxyrinchus oxyrinchus]|uniref:P21-activated protein kinase-interacting protein 1-like n=1 Tax=Acipenser oxyrinchus oxyrinchus TaxID=40147 RepID=A0AAD8GDF6_ACIOX|nr:p21-activated protein kinase-interacting protein 1-like [Acipenser oxyrinchus oxyrinchus]
MAQQLELIAGCYEQIVFGYRVQTGEKKWTSDADFSHHAHTASLSAVAVNDRYIATGSKDETIQLYDIKKRVEYGSLLHHDGTISCLEFYGKTHLLSGGEDGLICVWSTKKWECLKSFRAHKGHVTSLSVHPSGKIVLSVGTDKTLRTWNLIDGRSAFIKNIKQNAHIVMWSPTGERYVVVVNEKMDIYNLETATVTGTISNKKRISSIRFITNTIVVVAGDEETVRLYDTDSLKCLCEFKAHENRVKAIYSITVGETLVLVTASSDGYIKMWKLDLEKIQDTPALLGEVNTSARLTCLGVWQGSPVEGSQQVEAEAACSQVQPSREETQREHKDHTTEEDSIKLVRNKKVEFVEDKIATKKRKAEETKKKKKRKSE